MSEMQLLDLDFRFWNYVREGTYLDSDGFNEVNAVVVHDGMTDEYVATVLFAGTPVLVVRCGADYTHESPMWDDTLHAQAYAAWLTEIGEADMEAAAWVAEHPGESLEDSDLMSDGHEYIAFVGVVARAIHAKFPDETPEPRGW